MNDDHVNVYKYRDRLAHILTALVVVHAIQNANNSTL